jgi:hypothetical protein
MSETTPASSSAATVAFTLVVVATWMLLHLYRGMVNDAVIYAMQGLVHLQPRVFQHDIFFRFGSQDRYTLFGALLYAPLIRALGLEHATVALWVGSQAALAGAAWTLARRLMGRSEALLAVGLLYALELSYGAQGIFYVVEDFLSPRILGEALVLWGIAAALGESRLCSGLCLIAALLIHPLMAAAGVLVVVWLQINRTEARRAARWIGPALAGAIAAAALLGSAVLSGRMDFGWLALLGQNTPYLLPSHWAGSDWARTAVPLATLWLAMRVLPVGVHRRLAGAALGVALTGLALAILAESLRLTLLIQAQPWRWQWAAAVVATLSLPPLALRLAGAGSLGRAALLLLAATYLLHDLPYCVPVGVLAVVLAWRLPDGPANAAPPAAAEPATARGARLAVVFAWGVFSVALAWDVLMRVYSAHRPYGGVSGAPVIEILRRLTRDSALPALLLACLWRYAYGSRRPNRSAVLASLAALGCLLLMPVTVSQWTHVTFTAGLVRAFQPWRQQIAAGAEVLWPDDPLYAWQLLDRPSYVSTPQLGAELFSRPAARILAQRVQALRPFLSLEGFWGPRPLPAGWSYEPQTLADICAASDVRYVVTAQPLASAAVAAAPAGVGAPFAGLHLYACSPRQ